MQMKMGKIKRFTGSYRNSYISLTYCCHLTLLMRKQKYIIKIQIAEKRKKYWDLMFLLLSYGKFSCFWERKREKFPRKKRENVFSCRLLDFSHSSFSQFFIIVSTVLAESYYRLFVTGALKKVSRDKFSSHWKNRIKLFL